MNIAVMSFDADDRDTGARGAFDAVSALRGTPGADYLDCRFPIGEPRMPDFQFCCKKSMTGSVYCSTHQLQCSGGFPQPMRKK